MSFDNGMNWNNALRYDVPTLTAAVRLHLATRTKLLIPRETAVPGVPQRRGEDFRTERGLKVTPYAGVKLRHTLEGGFRSATPETLT